MVSAEEFWRELNDDYYKAFPRLWEEEPLYADGPDFVAILDGKADIFSRRIANDEQVSNKGILRAGRMVWEVGRVYRVRKEPWVEPVLGEIKLIAVNLVNQFWADLIFEVEESDG